MVAIGLMLAALSLPLPAPVAAQTQVAWPQFGYDAQHSGANPLETTITQANAPALKRLFRVKLANPKRPSVADGAPVYLSNVTINGPRDLLFLTTRDGWILALDAHTGKKVWGKHYGPKLCVIHNTGATACFSNSSPALDPDHHYVYSYGLDGFVHKFDVATGAETHDAHWPELVSLKPFNEKESSPLSTATDRHGNRYLYVTTSGYLGDEGDYQGHLTAIDLTTGVQHVFNMVCSATDAHFALTPGTPDCPETRAAIWARPGVSYDPDTDLIYLATGNAPFDPASHYWGDSVVALHPDGTGVNGDPVDSFTPTDQQTLFDSDEDLGSTGPVILPPIAGSAYPHLAIQGRKINRAHGNTAEVWLIDLDNLSRSATPGPGRTGGEIGSRLALPQGGFLMSQPVAWVDPADPGRPWVFIANEGGIIGLRLYVDPGSTIPTFHPGWPAESAGRAQPIVENGVLYYLSADGIQAFRPTDGKRLWRDGSVRNFHWESPIVANGVLYATDEGGHLSAYAPAVHTPKE
jgi:outer membrane protein assembly factor BamB